MATESSTKHAWIPILVAIITSSAAIIGAWIGANSRSQISALEAEKQRLNVQVAEARSNLATCQEDLKLAQQTKPTPRAPDARDDARDVLDRRPPVDTPPSPTEVATLRVRIKIGPGYDQASVYLDGTLKPIAKRGLYWLELDAPRKTEPTFVRLEAKGRTTCEKLVHLQPSDDGIPIC